MIAGNRLEVSVSKGATKRRRLSSGNRLVLVDEV
jgi:hypothetical protein